MNRTKIQNEVMFMLDDEEYSDSIIPFLKKELKRKVNLHGRVILKGGVYCHNLEIEGHEIYIQKSVFAEDAITINSSKPGLVWFNSPVSSGNSILVEETSKSKIRFGKSIESKRIHLNKSIVYGNIIAENAIIKDSVVLGGVYCSQRIEVDNSIIGTYHCHEIVQVNNLGLLYPIAFSDTRPNISNNIYMVIPYSGNDEDVINIYKITQDEFHEVSDGNGSKYFYSNTLRIFDMKQYESKFRANLERLYDNYATEHDKQDKYKALTDFDNLYFDFISSGFKASGRLVYSDFMDIDNETIKNQSSDLVSFLLSSSPVSQNMYTNSSEKSSATQPEEKNPIIFNPDRLPDNVNTKQETERLLCTRCNKEYANDNSYCKDCGIPLIKSDDQIPGHENQAKDILSGSQSGLQNENEAGILKCPSCGSAVSDKDYVFCPDCGHKLNN